MTEKRAADEEDEEQEDEEPDNRRNGWRSLGGFTKEERQVIIPEGVLKEVD